MYKVRNVVGIAKRLKTMFSHKTEINSIFILVAIYAYTTALSIHALKI